MLFVQGGSTELSDGPGAHSEEFLLYREVALGWHWRNDPELALCWMLKTSPALTKIFSFLNVTCRERKHFWINASH